MHQVTLRSPAAVMVWLCVALVGCTNHKLEKEFFFYKPAFTRIDRLRQYPLEDQYRIFRYGNDKFHPPLIGLARPLAERGKIAIPFLLKQINPPADDIALRDVLQVFETMSSMKSYDVASNATVMDVLRSKVASMKDAGWKDVCVKMQGRIEAHKGTK